ncbi:hypothetical protein Nm8I071_25240 [Nonomuraea sp. TT08I-71]|nr:hypothetical protein Nm8I071_25240 [Nonomuraea sp. TT08I-71]
MQVLTQEGEDLAACRSSGRDEAGHAQEAVDGPRVAGQACVGAVGAEAFDVRPALVARGVEVAGDDQRGWQAGVAAVRGDRGWSSMVADQSVSGQVSTWAPWRR